MIKRYTKKPIPVEAIQWDGSPASAIEIAFWAKRYNVSVKYLPMDNYPSASLVVETLEGEMKALAGDYIIRGVRNEFYPCRKDIFEETYEPL